MVNPSCNPVPASTLTALRHDLAWEASLALLELVEPLLREEEFLDARLEFHAVLKALLERYETRAARQRRRHRPAPSPN